MNLRKQLQNEIADQGQRIVKAASFQLIPIIVIAWQFFVLWFSQKDNLFPDKELRAKQKKQQKSL